MGQTLCEEGLLSMGAGVLVLQVPPLQTLLGFARVHQVAQEGLVASRGVFHVLELKLEDQRVDPVPVGKKVKPQSKRFSEKVPLLLIVG